MFELYALKYGVSDYPEKYVYADCEKSVGRVPFAWLFYLIRYEGQNILVDTGFYDRFSALRFTIELTDPLSLLAELDLQPEDIHTILLTHAHFDHTGTLTRFPNASIYLNRAEMQYFTTDGAYQKYLEQARREERLHLFDRFVRIEDHFMLRRVGGHTIGSSALFFKHEGVPWCITGDEAYLSTNVDQLRGVGTCRDREANLHFLKNLRELEIRPLTMHDPGIVPAESKVLRLI